MLVSTYGMKMGEDGGSMVLRYVGVLPQY